MPNNSIFKKQTLTQNPNFGEEDEKMVEKNGVFGREDGVIFKMGQKVVGCCTEVCALEKYGFWIQGIISQDIFGAGRASLGGPPNKMADLTPRVSGIDPLHYP